MGIPVIALLQYGGLSFSSAVLGMVGNMLASSRTRHLQNEQLQIEKTKAAAALEQVASSRESAEALHIASLNGIIETYRVELERYKKDREDIRLELGAKIDALSIELCDSSKVVKRLETTINTLQTTAFAQTKSSVEQGHHVDDLTSVVAEQSEKLATQTDLIAQFVVNSRQQAETLVAQLEEITSLKAKVEALSEHIGELMQVISDQKVKLAGPANPSEPTVGDVNKAARSGLPVPVSPAKVAKSVLSDAAQEAQALLATAAVEAQNLLSTATTRADETRARSLLVRAAAEAQGLLAKAAQEAKRTKGVKTASPAP